MDISNGGMVRRILIYGRRQQLIKRGSDYIHDLRFRSSTLRLKRLIALPRSSFLAVHRQVSDRLYKFLSSASQDRQRFNLVARFGFQIKTIFYQVACYH